MKKIVGSAAAFVTSFSLLVGIMPFSEIAYAVNTETGIMDVSDITFEFGEIESMSLTMETVPKILAGEEKDYLLGSHLDDNNKAVYAAFQKLVNPSLDEFTVTLPKPVRFQTEDITGSENTEFYNAVFSSCASGMEAASFDTPWVFWLDQNFTSVSAGNMKYTKDWMTGIYTFTIEELTFAPAAYEGFASFAEVGEYKAKLEEAVDSYVIEGETVSEKIRSIHDQICYFTDYDLDGRFNGSALSAIVEPGAVCEGYSKGFKLLCDSIGIPNICVFGNYNESTATAHMWNYVRMEDGYWYAVDVTWDDYDGDYGYELVDTYFLKGSDDFNVKHTPYNDYNLTHLEYPELAAWNYGETPTVSETATEQITTTTVKTTSTTAKPTETTSTIIPTETTTKKSTVKTTTSATVKPTETTVKTTTTTEKPATTKKSTTTDAPAVTTVTTTAPKDEFEYGDLNHDGKVSIADLVYCASFVIGAGTAEYSCDINNDGRADVCDVVIMRKIIIEKVLSAVIKEIK